MPPAIEMVGKTFGRLLVVQRLENGKDGKPVFLCLCSCGKKKNASGSHLRRGNIQSCGCLMGANLKTHEMRYTREYSIWTNMKTRCSNPRVNNYSNYGGRGITVCVEWEKSFEKFFEDMGKCPEGFSLERIDVNRGYSKENCKWIPLADQSKNKRYHKRFDFQEKSLTIQEMFETVGYSCTKNEWDKVYQRITRYGWSAEKAIEDFSSRS